MMHDSFVIKIVTCKPICAPPITFRLSDVAAAQRQGEVTKKRKYDECVEEELRYSKPLDLEKVEMERECLATLGDMLCGPQLLAHEVLDQSKTLLTFKSPSLDLLLFSI